MNFNTKLPTGYVSRGIHGQTVEWLAHQIVRGDLPGGSLIDIPALQRDLGVSMTVIREALKILGAKGMVEARQKKGTFVRPRSSWILLDPDVLRWHAEGTQDQTQLLENLQELREILEPATARLAAERSGSADLEALDDAMVKLSAADNDPEATTTADIAFHRALLDATHNELMSRLDGLMAVYLAMRDHLVHGDSTAPSPVRAHQSVLDAVRAKDGKAAEAAMQGLLRNARHSIEQLPRPADETRSQ